MFGMTKPLDFGVSVRVHAVEMGLERAQPGGSERRTTTPMTVTAPNSRTPPSVGSSRPARPSPSRSGQRIARPQTPEGEITESLPTPRVRLREPQLALAHRQPRILDPAQTSLSDAGSLDTQSIPSFASAAGDLASAIPRGAVVTLLLRSDRIRNDPNAPAVRRLLASIPDWDAMIGGSDLDPLQDLDWLMLAAANPFGTEGRPPDWFVLARGAGGSDAAMRRAVEQLATQNGPRAPSPIAPPPLDGAIASDPWADGGEPDAGRGRSIWETMANGVQIATLERYRARRSFVLLGHGMAAIALPGQVERLLTTMAQRGEGLLGSSHPRLVLLLEAEGVANLLALYTQRGPFPMPNRMALALYQILDESGAPTGGAELSAIFQYDHPTEAEHAREMLEYSRGQWHLMIAQYIGRGGLAGLLNNLGASLFGIDLAALEQAIDAMRIRTDGSRVSIRAEFTPAQVRAVLSLASVGGAMQ